MNGATITQMEHWQSQMSTYLGGNDNTTATVDQLYAWKVKFDEWLDKQTPPPSKTGLPAHRFGVHLISNREGDLSYAEKLRPAAIKIVDPDPAVVRRMLNAIDPNGVVILRDHPLSEQKMDMKLAPIDTGKRHAADWLAKLSTGRFKEFNGDPRIVVCGINEPDVHNAAEEQLVYLYTKAFLEDLTAGGVRGLALNLSVGWPRNSGEGTPPVWDSFLPLESLILKGNHFLCTHEYWLPNPQDKWGWYGNRISKCPMSVPVIIGECAYTRQLANQPQPWGWIGNMSAGAYADQLWWYHDNVDPNVFAILPFTSGYASSEWASKDILPAADEILKRVHNYTWPDVWPVDKGDEAPEDEPMHIIFPHFTGAISGYYGSVYRNSAGACYGHEGLDLPKAVGTPYVAPFDGVVAYSGTDALYGEYIRTWHPKLKLCFFAAHLSQRLVQNGETVTQGQLLGKTGNTGNSTGPHLHFSVRQMDSDGKYIAGRSVNTNATMDPLAWLAGWLSAGNTYEER